MADRSQLFISSALVSMPCHALGVTRTGLRSPSQTPRESQPAARCCLPRTHHTCFQRLSLAPAAHGGGVGGELRALSPLCNARAFRWCGGDYGSACTLVRCERNVCREMSDPLWWWSRLQTSLQSCACDAWHGCMCAKSKVASCATETQPLPKP